MGDWIHRLLSLAVVIASIVAFNVGDKSPLSCGVYFSAAAILIWFPQFFADFSGPTRGGWADASPAPIVRFFGWLLLIVGPLALYFIFQQAGTVR